MVASAPVTIPIHALKLSPGSHLLIENVSWEQYDALLTELGEERLTPRINYCNNTLELMAPLPIHERPHRLIADIVKALLDSQDRDWEDFGSTTFRKAQAAGLEPDTCFYIQNAEQMRGCERFDSNQDPPPDLAIESDVTSKTTLDTYCLLGVPEVWIYTSGALKIYLLQDDGYLLSAQSLTFPSLPLDEMIPTLLQQAKQMGTRKMLKQLRLDMARQDK
ncbi:Uma2 family endonuclease [Leptothoe kymatousa]|uniref:Uma2 family endonuclease n=1 Tax=Leptothoe kymatousa TAU-MAC 1615 TaxID=2364775 RepID=A0ABS5Y348_9CYAN|nr:Uma2 family endonuclease [Leptothoe kymatousa]MBT9312259.1 Uma2 family endonuclease [Leptothoe kymatousa TAU-MAC 1615]